MALRDMVMGAGNCAVPGEASSSSNNPLAGLASSFLGSSSKQERVRELPSFQGPGQPLEFGQTPVVSLPGSEYGNVPLQESQASEFLRTFHDVHHGGYDDVWNEATQSGMDDIAKFAEFERIYGQDAGVRSNAFNERPHQALSGFLQSFLASSRREIPFHPVQLPEMGLSESDKHRIRDRSSIMARHFFADKGDEYVNAQVTALLQSLDIEDNLRMRDPLGGRFSEMEQYWNDGQKSGSQLVQTRQADNWSNEYGKQYGNKNGWVEEFQSQHDGDSWASQFSEDQKFLGRRSGEFDNIGAMEQTRSLVDTLSQNKDPKFQTSKFFHFVSKMSRGELIIEDNQVKENVAAQWANEYDSQDNFPAKWAKEYDAQYANPDKWAADFEEEREVWIPKESGNENWAEEYAQGKWREDLNGEDWNDSYEKFVEEQVKGELGKRSSSSKWVYVFADQNPYVGHPTPLKEGQDLFRKGLLSEAVLALEAEVLRNPENSEAWRLLGITHAENDDDRQAIASMVRARDADPTNLEILLALGVSHTNELEQVEALGYLRGWLQHHSKYGSLVPEGEVDRLNHFEVVRLFNEAASMYPEDGDVHTVLGVLYNLSREYDKAIEAFETALKLKPRDYSLWNKLGATQANSARSADAIYAYQQALNLKPNYVRAWSNMGIGYANQGRYQESIRYYVRALCMNPKADNAWQYLRMSLSATRVELVDACDRHDLDLLQAEFPLS